MKRTLLALLVILACASSQGAVFQGLGDLPGGTFFSAANGISSDGSVIVGRSWSSSGIEAFRWTEETGLVGLGDLPGGSYSGCGYDISADGSIITGYSGSDLSAASMDGHEAFRWTEETGMVAIGDLPGGYYGGDGVALSEDGSVIVGVGYSHLGSEAYRWTEETGVVGLGDLEGGQFGSSSSGISADGSVIAGSSYSALGHEAFRWTEDTGMIALGDLPGGLDRSISRGISSDGSVIIGASDTDLDYEAFRWSEETGMVGLGDLPGGAFYSSAEAVSTDGSVIVGTSKTGFGLYAIDSEAFVWDDVNGIRNLKTILEGDYGLDLTGWHLRSAQAVSGDGMTIAGLGINPDGYDEAWVATIPEPATFVLLGLGGMMLRCKNKNK